MKSVCGYKIPLDVPPNCFMICPFSTVCFVSTEFLTDFGLYMRPCMKFVFLRENIYPSKANSSKNLVKFYLITQILAKPILSIPLGLLNSEVK